MNPIHMHCWIMIQQLNGILHTLQSCFRCLMFWSMRLGSLISAKWSMWWFCSAISAVLFRPAMKMWTSRFGSSTTSGLRSFSRMFPIRRTLRSWRFRWVLWVGIAHCFFLLDCLLKVDQSYPNNIGIRDLVNRIITEYEAEAKPSILKSEEICTLFVSFLGNYLAALKVLDVVWFEVDGGRGIDSCTWFSH